MTQAEYRASKRGVFPSLEALGDSIGYRDNGDLLEVAKVNAYEWISTNATAAEIVKRYNAYDGLVEISTNRAYHISITATLDNKVIDEATVVNLTKEEATLDNPYAKRYAFELQNKHPKAKITIW